MDMNGLIPPHLHEIWKYIRSFVLVGVFAAIGGTLDYLKSVQEKRRYWSVLGFAIHILIAIFVGIAVSTMVTEAGQSARMAGAAAGVSGLANVRLIDALQNIVKRKIWGE